MSNNDQVPELSKVIEQPSRDLPPKCKSPILPPSVLKRSHSQVYHQQEEEKVLKSPRLQLKTATFSNDLVQYQDSKNLSPPTNGEGGKKIVQIHSNKQGPPRFQSIQQEQSSQQSVRKFFKSLMQQQQLSQEEKEQKSLHDLLPSEVLKAFKAPATPLIEVIEIEDEVIEIEDSSPPEIKEEREKMEIIQQILHQRELIEKEKRLRLNCQAEIEKITSQVAEMEAELEDINEQVEEKLQGKILKKRESYQRLDSATHIYHSEKFLARSYLKAFTKIKNMYFQEPEMGGYDLKGMVLSLYYESVNKPNIMLPIVMKLYTFQDFVAFKQRSNLDYSEFSVEESKSQSEDSSQPEEDRKSYVSLRISDVIFNFETNWEINLQDVLPTKDQLQCCNPIYTQESYYLRDCEFFFEDRKHKSKLKIFIDSVIENLEKIVLQLQSIDNQSN